MDYQVTAILLEGGVCTKASVLIRNLPPLLRDLVEHSISTQADMEVVNEEKLQSQSIGPDVVIVGTMQVEQSGNATETLLRWPRAQVLMIRVDGHKSALYELEVRRDELGEMSPAELVDRIRACVERRRTASTWA